MKPDLISLIEVAIDSLGTPDYEIFITYFENMSSLGAPEWYPYPRTPENEARALELWDSIGRKILEAMR